MLRLTPLLFTMLFVSTSSGTEWKEFTNEQYLHHFWFATPDIGWGIDESRNSGIFETTDGGKSWKKIPYQCTSDEDETERTPVFFWGSLHRWILNKDTIRYSNNGGKSWDLILQEIDGLKSIYFLNETNGVANDDTCMYWTNDCGRKWQKAEMDSTNILTIYSTYFLDSMNGWIAGWSYSHWDAGTVLHTSDGGRTWKTVILSNLFNSIYCTDALHCFAVGLNPMNRCGAITITSDGWKTKRDIYLSPYLDKVVFLNSQTGLVIGDGQVWGTNDSGNTWTKIENIGTALSIGRSNNALFISTIGKLFKYEFTTSTMVNQSPLNTYRSRATSYGNRMIIVNNNPFQLFNSQSTFDLLGKTANRITGCSPGCFLLHR